MEEKRCLVSEVGGIDVHLNMTMWGPDSVDISK